MIVSKQLCLTTFFYLNGRTKTQHIKIVMLDLDKLEKIIKHKNIINFIRAQRLGWLGHIERMQETRMVKAIHTWKPISKRPIGRPKTRWEDDVRKDIVVVVVLLVC